jgi:hypothetical protein
VDRPSSPVTAKVLQGNRGVAHPGIAIRAAKAAGMSVEAVIVDITALFAPLGGAR